MIKKEQTYCATCERYYFSVAWAQHRASERHRKLIQLIEVLYK